MKYLIFLITIGFISCNSKSLESEFSLKEANSFIILPTRESINPKTRYLQYIELNNRSYLSYGNRDRNELIIFDLIDGQIFKRIIYNERGPNGIGKFRGAYIHNFDSIFVISVTYFNDFFLTDTSGKVKKKFHCNLLDGKVYKPALEAAESGLEIILEGKTINLNTYLFSFVENKELFKETIGIEYDLSTEKISSDFNYPEFENPGKQSLRHYKRTYNGEKFVYSFLRSDDIYVKNDSSGYSVYPGKSRFRKKDLDWAIERTDPILKQKKIVVSNPTYRNIYFDKYKEVYYRFFQPGTEVDSVTLIDKYFEYPMQFSIQVFDPDFNLLTERLMPPDTYDQYMAFITPDGLYSALHFDHPLYDPDAIKFERIELVK